MGGTSLLFTGFSIGIILSVSRGEIEEFGVKKGNANTNEVRKISTVSN